jgi:hypothetical protein
VGTDCDIGGVVAVAPRAPDRALSPATRRAAPGQLPAALPRTRFDTRSRHPVGIWAGPRGWAPRTAQPGAPDVPKRPVAGGGSVPQGMKKPGSIGYAEMPSIRARASSAPYGCRYGSQRGSLWPVPMMRQARPEGGAGL